MLNQYLKQLFKVSSGEEATEESYYPTLAGLFEDFFDSEKVKNGTITVLPKKKEGNKPDFVIRKSKELVGYIEAKDFTKTINLESIESSEQIERYKKDFDNFILTNFVDFWLWRKSEKDWVKKVKIAQSKLIGNFKIIPPLENPEKLLGLITDFINFSIPETKSAKQLATELASRAKRMREPLHEELINKIDTDVDKIFRAFKKYLMPDLTEENFADIYAQTITYGLFIARLQFKGEGKDFNRMVARDLIPKNLKILRDTFYFVSRRDLTQNIDYIIDDIATVLAYCNIEKIKKDLHEEKGKDPIVHFYETFLIEYDKEKRKRLGEYYTPLPVVSYIIRSINILLKEKFGKDLGFASRGVTLLDFASGTCTFPAQAIIQTKEEIDRSNISGDWTNTVKKHVLENFYAFEISMASWIIGHLKIALLLENLGYKMTNGDKFKLYLTNTLDFTLIKGQDAIFSSNLSEEAQKAGEVKRNKPILVIMGNPPYSGRSSNIGGWISKEIKTYYQINGVQLKEKTSKWLQDDYVKFIRFAQWKIDQMDEGIIGIITNHSYLDNPTFRGMRHSLMQSFNEIYLLDAHGSSLRREKSPDGIANENVFNIRQGVSIAFFIKDKKVKKELKIYHYNLWGTRKEKFDWLSNEDIKSTKWQMINPKPEYYLFISRNEKFLKNYEKFIKINDIFSIYGVGITTARDNFIIEKNKNTLLNRVRLFKNYKGSDKELHQYFQINTKKGWNIRKSWESLQEIADSDLNDLIRPILYRLFDERWIFYHDSLVWRTVKKVMNNMVSDNIGLITTRQVNGDFCHAFVANNLIESSYISNKTKEINNIFPLYLNNQKKRQPIFNGQKTLAFPGVQLDLEKQSDRISNIKKEIFISLENIYKQKVSAKEIFGYIYAILYSNKYRQKYNEFLKIDFPRIPFSSDFSLFKKLSKLGEELTTLHLLKSKSLNKTTVKFKGTGLNEVKKREYNEKERKLYINDSQYLKGIEKEVWNYHIGGYQVLDKWMKDRIGGSLSREDIEHYLKVIDVLRKTIEMQNEIDKLYPKAENTVITTPKV